MLKKKQRFEPIQFFVPGNPVALKRHRQGKYGNYDPSANDKADFLAKAIANKPDKPIDEPVELWLEFCFKRPKSHFRTGKFSDQLKPNAPYWHTSTPDVDNLIKMIGDSLNGIFWSDDKAIAKCLAMKHYWDRPGVIIDIRPLKRQRFNPIAPICGLIK